ncbi:hypothetical protein, partial [Bradyrhizobium sp. 179]|uniref:hypothetical protein n=1 Tax=Bradyrhizobium sp. 179 TaxID=2782648 RepID=UPI001FF94940
RKIPRSGRRAGLQSNKELIINLDTPNPHVSNPDCTRRDISELLFFARNDGGKTTSRFRG